MYTIEYTLEMIKNKILEFYLMISDTAAILMNRLWQETCHTCQNLIIFCRRWLT